MSPRWWSSGRPVLGPSLKESLRATAKELVWTSVRFEQGPLPNIGLYCTRRGGSTWLMQTIGAEPGILPLNQPLEAFTPNLTPYQFSRLPVFERGAIVHPDAEEERELRAYTDELMAGRMRVNAPHAPWRPEFSFRTSRLLLKILSAKPMMDWFEENYGVQTVYLVRHPVPQALSCLRNGWGTSTMAYLHNEWFREQVIADDPTFEFARRVAAHGTDLQRFVLNWVVENLYPLSVLAERPHWLALSYEECVLERDRVLDEVCTTLRLSDIDRVRRSSTQASRSSGLSTSSTIDAIERGEHAYLVSGWLKGVTAEDRRDVDEILDRFGISLYSSSSALPDWAGYR